MSMTFVDALRLNARRFPRKSGIVFEGEQFSFGKLYERVCALATVFGRYGIARADRVVLLTPEHPDGALVYIALMGLGAIPVLLAPNLPDEDLDYLCRKCGAGAAVVIRQTVGKVPLVNAAIGRIFHLDPAAAAPAGVVDLEPLLATAPRAVVPDWSAADTLSMFHTSGTTDRPKLLLRRKWAFEERSIEQGLADRDVALNALPLSGGLGLNWLLQALYIGATTFLLPDHSPEAVMRAIDTECLSAVNLTPAMLRAMVLSPQFNSFSGQSLRSIQTGAGVVTPDVRRAFLKKCGPIMSIYAASTEHGPFACLKGPDVERFEGNCVGHAYFGAEVILVDEDGNEVPPGETGEISVRSNVQFEAYLDDFDAGRILDPAQFNRVGDLGRFDEDGNLYLLGRKGDMVVIDGELIMLPEIELALAGHVGVREVAAVTGRRDGVQVIVAAVVVQPGCTVADLHAHCERVLPAVKRPAEIRLFASFPKTASGKIRKAEVGAQVFRVSA